MTDQLPAAPTQAAAVTGERFGPYLLESLIGRGGMGEVYRAVDTVKGRTVALKLLPAHLARDDEFRVRFRRESEVAARLREAHIVPIHDFGEIDGRLYIDMRLVDGVDLADLLTREEMLRPGHAVHIIAQVACALDAAHDDGLIHRDIKPSNVLVTGERGNEFVYLADFGVAAPAAATRLTAAGAYLGTLGYMAPEQFLNGHADRRADVYALGCMLFELLTGETPFAGDDLPALMFAHVNLPPPRLSQRRSDIPPAFDEVIARAMAKEPQARYERASDLAAAAHDAITGRGAVTVISASRPTPHLERPAVPVALPRRRRRAGRLAGITAAVAVVLSGAAITLDRTVFSDAPAPSPVVAVATRFVEAEGRFGLDAPPAWVVDAVGANGTSVLFFAPKESLAPDATFRPNINVVVTERPEGVDVVSATRKELRSIPDYRQTVDAPVTLADGTQAHQFGGTFTFGDNALRNVQIIAPRGDESIVVTGTAPAEDWIRLSPVFETSLSTLSVQPMT